MLKVDRATHTQPFLPAEPAGMRRGASAALYQSTSSSAAKGEFFSLWSVVKTIGRSISSIFSSIWHLICCCPSYKFSWLTVELVKPLLHGLFYKLETLTKIRDGVFEVQDKDGGTTKISFSINGKGGIDCEYDNGQNKQVDDMGSSVVFSRISEKVPDKLAYFHNGHVGLLHIEKSGPAEYTIEGTAPQTIREDFRYKLTGKFVWKSHLTRNPDADLSWITEDDVMSRLWLNATNNVVRKEMGKFSFTAALGQETVEYFINTLDELVEYLPATETRHISGTKALWSKLDNNSGSYLYYDFGKHYPLRWDYDIDNDAYVYTGNITQGVFDELPEHEVGNAVWITTDPASAEVLKRNGFKYRKASEAWIRSAENA